jgi:hypothetical protein
VSSIVKFKLEKFGYKRGMYIVYVSDMGNKGESLTYTVCSE